MKVLKPNLLQVYSRVPSTHTLGPGKRYALWVQGCPFRCKGCLAPNSLATDDGEEISISTLVNEVCSVTGLEGITISGGEPFAQAKPLAILASKLQNHGYGVIVYSGYILSTLQRKAVKDQGIKSFLDHIDLLIDGLYIASKDDGKSLRGSSNQQLHFLTGRYSKVAKEYYNLPHRHVELHSIDNSLMLVGVPGKEIMKKITHE